MQFLRENLKIYLDRLFLRNIIIENKNDISIIKGQIVSITDLLKKNDQNSNIIINAIEALSDRVKEVEGRLYDSDQNIDRMSSLQDVSEFAAKRLDEVEIVLLKKVDAAVRDFRAIERNGFRQIEAYNNLKLLLGKNILLSPTRGWAASPDFLLHLYNHVLENKPNLVVEVGSGVSTLVIASALKKIGTGQLVSLDHDEQFACQTESNLKRHKLDDIVKVVHAKLADWTAPKATPLGETWKWYDVPPAIVPPEAIDLLVVDGPPERSGKYARYPAIPYFFDQISNQGYVFLDDMIRSDEKAAAKAWAEEYNFKLEILQGFEKGLAVLQKGACNHTER